MNYTLKNITLKGKTQYAYIHTLFFQHLVKMQPVIANKGEIKLVMKEVLPKERYSEVFDDSCNGKFKAFYPTTSAGKQKLQDFKIEVAIGYYEIKPLARTLRTLAHEYYHAYQSGQDIDLSEDDANKFAMDALLKFDKKHRSLDLFSLYGNQ